MKEIQCPKCKGKFNTSNHQGLCPLCGEARYMLGESVTWEAVYREDKKTDEKLKEVNL